MAPITSTSFPSQTDWNDTYSRLVEYLNTYALGDQSQVSRIALELLDQAKSLYPKDSGHNPTTLTLKLAQERIAGWLGTSLTLDGLPSSQVVASGCIALLLTDLSRTAPKAFLATALSDELKHSMRETLLTTGPDLNVSSMTPRHLDYGPMLDLARQTWHRWDGRSILITLAFWAAVYVALYWAITELL